MTTSQLQPARRSMATEAVPLGLALLVLLAAILRIFHIGSQSLWVDELITIVQGQREGYSLWRQFLDDLQSPLPMVLITWMGRISGDELWLRMPGAVLGAATIPLVFLTGRHLAGARVGLLAALLLAVHPFHVYHSQEVRGYAYMLFFGVATTLVALGARETLSWRRALSLSLLGIATSLCNLQGLFWMGSLALALLLFGRMSRRELVRWTVAFGLIVLVLTPWWSASLGIHETGRLMPGEDKGEPIRGETTMTPWAVPYAGFVLAVGNTLGPTPRQLHERVEAEGLGLDREHWPAVAGVAALALVLAWSGVLTLRRRSLALLLWVLIPVGLALLLATRNVKPFNPRYVIAALPAFMILIAAGIHGLPRRAGLMLLLAWISFQGLGLYRYYFDPMHGREDVRGAARLVQSREGPDDFILAPTVADVFRYYYRGQNEIRTHHADLWPTPEQTRERLLELEPDRRYLWYVRSRPWQDDPKGYLMAELEASYRRVALFNLVGVELILYDREAMAEQDPQGETP